MEPISCFLFLNLFSFCCVLVLKHAFLFQYFIAEFYRTVGCEHNAGFSTVVTGQQASTFKDHGNTLSVSAMLTWSDPTIEGHLGHILLLTGSISIRFNSYHLFSSSSNLSHFVSFRLVSSRLVLLCFVLCCVVLCCVVSCRVVSYRVTLCCVVWSCRVWSLLLWSCLVSYRIALSRLVSSHLISSFTCLVSSHFVSSCLVLSRFISFHLASTCLVSSHLVF